MAVHPLNQLKWNVFYYLTRARLSPSRSWKGGPRLLLLLLLLGLSGIQAHECTPFGYVSLCVIQLSLLIICQMSCEQPAKSSMPINTPSQITVD